MQIRSAGKTDVGRKRSHNEDRYLIKEEERLFVVCDGMGGHASGEIAAQLAIEQMAAFFDAHKNDPEITWRFKENKKLDSFEAQKLEASIKWANFAVHDTASGALNYKGMGTTCVAALLTDGRCIIGHVGDSRCYRIRDSKIELLTEDHSLLNDYKKLPNVTSEDVKNFPHKNVITRALGMKPTVQVDIKTEQIENGDIYLLCCDGLSGEVDDQEILKTVVEAQGDLQKTCDELIRKANEHGGRDNITVVLVEVSSQ
jgi:protein phosphatase